MQTLGILEILKGKLEENNWIIKTNDSELLSASNANYHIIFVKQAKSKIFCRLYDHPCSRIIRDVTIKLSDPSETFENIFNIIESKHAIII